MPRPGTCQGHQQNWSPTRSVEYKGLIKQCTVERKKERDVPVNSIQEDKSLQIITIITENNKEEFMIFEIISFYFILFIFCLH